MLASWGASCENERYRQNKDNDWYDIGNYKGYDRRQLRQRRPHGGAEALRFVGPAAVRPRFSVQRSQDRPEAEKINLTNQSRSP